MGVGGDVATSLSAQLSPLPAWPWAPLCSLVVGEEEAGSGDIWLVFLGTQKGSGHCLGVQGFSLQKGQHL